MEREWEEGDGEDVVAAARVCLWVGEGEEEEEEEEGARRGATARLERLEVVF
jgi:hypothetical protein